MDSKTVYEVNQSQVWSEVDNFTEDRYRQFSTFIKPGKILMDIGCNTGRGSQILKQLIPKILMYGVELVEARVKKIPEGIFEQVFNVPLQNLEGAKEGFFDYLIAGEVIEHIPKNEFHDFLVACKKLLKDDGRILFTTPNPNSFLVKLGRKGVENDPSHINLMTVKEQKAFLDEAGLVLEKVLGSGKVIRYLGSGFPVFDVYGSYLTIIRKNA